MKNYIVYNADGDILRSGRCNDADFDLQAGDGEFVIEGIADDDNQVINDGQVVERIYTDAELRKQVIEYIRQQRNAMLSASDWTQVVDAPLTRTKKDKFKTYRQALRDLPTTYSNETDIQNVVFPTPPTV